MAQDRESASSAPTTGSVKTRAANRVNHQKIIKDFYGGDTAAYNNNHMAPDRENIATDRKYIALYCEDTTQRPPPPQPLKPPPLPPLRPLLPRVPPPTPLPLPPKPKT